MEWYEILASMMAGVLITGVLLLFAVFLGGILVFKAKTITMPTPFLTRSNREKGEKASSYVSHLYNDVPDIMDDTLSPAAARLRDQKIADIDEHKSIMDYVRGKK